MYGVPCFPNGVPGFWKGENYFILWYIELLMFLEMTRAQRRWQTEVAPPEAWHGIYGQIFCTCFYVGRFGGTGTKGTTNVAWLVGTANSALLDHHIDIHELQPPSHLQAGQLKTLNLMFSARLFPIFFSFSSIFSLQMERNCLTSRGTRPPSLPIQPSRSARSPSLPSRSALPASLVNLT